MITPNVYLLGTSTVNLVITGDSGMYSEQTLVYRSNHAQRRCYAFPSDMYVGNANTITLSSNGGFILFNDGSFATGGIEGSKTVKRH